jgi:hypothetical protein
MGKNNKDVIRRNKNIQKQKHKNNVVKNKNKTTTKKEKEKYMRNNRNTSNYTLNEVKNNQFLYKINDWLIDLWMEYCITEKPESTNNHFWCSIASNKNSEFLFHNVKSLKSLLDGGTYIYNAIPEIGLLFHKYYLNQIIIPNDCSENDNESDDEYRDFNVMCNLISGDTSSQAMDLLEQDNKYIDWNTLCNNTNPRAIHIIEHNLDKLTTYISIYNLLNNPNAINLIENKLDKLIEMDGNVASVLGFPRYPEDVYAGLFKNPNALHIIDKVLEKNITLHNIMTLHRYLTANPNPNIINILKKHFDCFWSICDIADNPDAIHIIEEQIKDNDDVLYDGWCKLCCNPNAIHIIEQNIEKIINICKRKCETNKLGYIITKWFNNLCSNPNAIHIIEQYIEDFIDYDECCWLFGLCKNPNAIRIIEQYVLKHKSYVLLNPPDADKSIKTSYGYTESNRYTEDDAATAWRFLSCNPNALQFIEQNIHKINPKFLPKVLDNILPRIFYNPSIFEINYEYLQKQFDYKNRQFEIDEIIKKYKNKKQYLSYNNLVFNLLEYDLIKAVFHPRRVQHYLKTYNYYICIDEYCDE